MQVLSLNTKKSESMHGKGETDEGTADMPADKTGGARVYQNECDIVTLIVEILQICKELEQEFFARGVLQQAARSRVENRLGWRERWNGGNSDH